MRWRIVWAAGRGAGSEMKKMKQCLSAYPASAGVALTVSATPHIFICLGRPVARARTPHTLSLSPMA